MLDIPESLSERISKFEAKTAGKKRAPNSAQLPVKGVALAGRVATELVVGIAVGAFLGWIIDRWRNQDKLVVPLLRAWAWPLLSL